MTESEYISVSAWTTLLNIKSLMSGVLMPDDESKEKFWEAARIVSNLADELYKNHIENSIDQPETDKSDDTLNPYRE